MTRHYTHVGELAAGRAVALLPSMIGDATPEPERRERGEILRDVSAILKGMTAANWKARRAGLLSLLSNETH